jgi:hypothetical protein
LDLEAGSPLPERLLSNERQNHGAKMANKYPMQIKFVLEEPGQSSTRQKELQVSAVRSHAAKVSLYWKESAEKKCTSASLASSARDPEILRVVRPVNADSTDSAMRWDIMIVQDEAVVVYGANNNREPSNKPQTTMPLRQAMFLTSMYRLVDSTTPLWLGSRFDGDVYDLAITLDWCKSYKRCSYGNGAD